MFPGTFQDRVDQFGISSPQFRQKVWLLYCDVTRSMAEDLGVKVLDAPIAGQDDGFLAKPYWCDDPTHGNIDYGDLVIDAFLEAGVKVRQVTAEG